MFRIFCRRSFCSVGRWQYNSKQLWLPGRCQKLYRRRALRGQTHRISWMSNVMHFPHSFILSSWIWTLKPDNCKNWDAIFIYSHYFAAEHLSWWFLVSPAPLAIQDLSLPIARLYLDGGELDIIAKKAGRVIQWRPLLFLKWSYGYYEYQHPTGVLYQWHGISQNDST